MSYDARIVISCFTFSRNGILIPSRRPAPIGSSDGVSSDFITCTARCHRTRTRSCGPCASAGSILPVDEEPKMPWGLCAGRRIADLSDRYLERLLEKGSALEPSELRAAVEAEASRRRQAAAIAVPELREKH